MSLKDRVQDIRHFLDIDELSRGEILAALDRAEEFHRCRPERPLPMTGKVVGLFFFQPSTRTRIGFHAATTRLGGTAIELTDTRYEEGMSAAETPLDTFRSVSSYCDVIILRHRDEGEFQQMVRHSSVPIVNGGCGTSSHPTQTLLDLFAIRSHFGCIERLRIGLVGDLASSRAAKSLLKALKHFPLAELRLMAPEGRWGSNDVTANHPHSTLRRLSSVSVEGLDVVYMAGFPAKQGTGINNESTRASFRLGIDLARELRPGSIVLDPLPRIDEISPSIDELPQARYFEQSRLALFVRMSVLHQYHGPQPHFPQVQR